MTRNSLSERYRPRSIDEIIGQLLAVRKIKNLLSRENGIDCNLLFIGPPGTGKTSLAQCIAKEFARSQRDNWTNHFHKYTGRNLTLADLRGEITRLTQYKGNRIIFIDEADGLDINDQEVLTTLMEGSGNAVFVLSSNYADKIQPRIKSRCIILEFKALKPEDIYKRLVEISVAEGLIKTGASPELNRFYMKLSRGVRGDLRHAINELESFISNGSLDLDLMRESLG